VEKKQKMNIVMNAQFGSSQRSIKMTEKNQIILTAETDFQDNQLREWFSKMQVQIDTMNERSKRQTKEIKLLEKRIKIQEERNSIDITKITWNDKITPTFDITDETWKRAMEEGK
jgi:hypothetical protein